MIIRYLEPEVNYFPLPYRTVRMIKRVILLKRLYYIINITELKYPFHIIPVYKRIYIDIYNVAKMGIPPAFFLKGFAVLFKPDGFNRKIIRVYIQYGSSLLFPLYYPKGHRH